MYRYDRINKNILKLTVLFVAVLSGSTNAQPLTNFVDLNQSRQFFENGREQFEREINKFQQPLELPEIRLPEDFDKPKGGSNQKLIMDKKIEIKSVSNLPLDRDRYIYDAITF